MSTLTRERAESLKAESEDLRKIALQMRDPCGVLWAEAYSKRIVSLERLAIKLRAQNR